MVEQHIKALRLLNLSQESGLEVMEEEETHLVECEDCQQTIAVFALLFGKERPRLMPDPPLT